MGEASPTSEKVSMELLSSAKQISLEVTSYPQGIRPSTYNGLNLSISIWEGIDVVLPTETEKPYGRQESAHSP